MTEDYGYEIDMLPVGSGDKSGDAIATRYGNRVVGYKTMVVDGGTLESGEKLIEHINEYYGTNHVDFVVCTHPDNDHSSGLRKILETMTVGQLWLHKPWEYGDHVFDYVSDGRVTNNSLAQKIKDSLATAKELENIAKEKGIPVYEPFTGCSIGKFTVLSPSKDFYKELLVEEYGDSNNDQCNSTLSRILSNGKDFISNFIAETWEYETLREGGVTSPINETSVVMYANFSGQGVLLTGDSGVRALEKVSDILKYNDISSDNLRFIQIPHHGSKRNVSPSILNNLIGFPNTQGYGRQTPLSAFVSASKDSNLHPRKVVTNAFIRRGASVIATQGQTKRFSHRMPDRIGWSGAALVPFEMYVESYDD